MPATTPRSDLGDLTLARKLVSLLFMEEETGPEVKGLAQVTQLVHVWSKLTATVAPPQKVEPGQVPRKQQGKGLGQKKRLSWAERRQPEGETLRRRVKEMPGASLRHL